MKASTGKKKDLKFWIWKI